MKSKDNGDYGPARAAKILERAEKRVDCPGCQGYWMPGANTHAIGCEWATRIGPDAVSPTLTLVHKPGSAVTIGDDVPATIKQVCLSGDGITYEVVWWSGRERKTAWLAAHEIGGGEWKTVGIGFHT